MGRFVFAVAEKCIGCRTCEIACVKAHPDENGHTTLTLGNFAPRLHVVKSRTVTAPVQCHHCDNAPCIAVCPTRALVYDNDTVQMVNERCIGCSQCVVACPFGAMTLIDVGSSTADPLIGHYPLNQTKYRAHKCDLCNGRSEGPACIAVCPTKALYLVPNEMP